MHSTNGVVQTRAHSQIHVMMEVSRLRAQRERRLGMRVAMQLFQQKGFCQTPCRLPTGR